MKKMMIIMAMMLTIAVSANAKQTSNVHNDKAPFGLTLVVNTPHATLAVQKGPHCRPASHFNRHAYPCCNGRHKCHLRDHKMCKACKKEMKRMKKYCKKNCDRNHCGPHRHSHGTKNHR